MTKSFLLALGGLAALLSVGMFVYGSWLWIIQTNGDRWINASGVMLFVAVCCFVLGVVWRR